MNEVRKQIVIQGVRGAFHEIAARYYHDRPIDVIPAITFNEFLPALLGEGAISEYSGYDPSVNPGISNVFSTAMTRRSAS